MSDPRARLQPYAAAYRRMRWGVSDLVSPTSALPSSPPRQRSITPTLPVSTPDRPSLAHGGHDGRGHAWRR
jgi:hypothetical protein